jgi:hypothetical protein
MQEQRDFSFEARGKVASIPSGSSTSSLSGRDLIVAACYAIVVFVFSCDKIIILPAWMMNIT